MKSIPFYICLCLLGVSLYSAANAQVSRPTEDVSQRDTGRNQASFALKAGLSQPVLLRGANLAIAYTTGRWVFEYSHGLWLSYDRVGRTRTERDQNLDVYSPWTTGFGIGYRLPWRFDLRVELKAHRYEVTPPQGKAFAYTTFSIGPALNYHQPIYRNLGLDLTLRFWPNVASTLENDERVFFGADGAKKTHAAHDLGVFPNASLLYKF
ncbi:hypothetical protein CRI94_10335 [Longibacter salinarum]|uniref:Outer membrane protein beta-barrel domain-containing protein n=1 Tax=Longibacter salinarum TaxID=1850348 RepID=A0A2A8CWS5_9BACT|nr:hypothetical protein [Longibacter salinarum]PEN13044.1 hypothetical protein CRI94_10335 [Longibacter salinarum]